MEKIIKNPDPMANFFKNVVQKEPLKEVLGMLFTADDVSVKTRINNPPALASLKSLAKICTEIGFTRCGSDLDEHIDIRNEYFISEKGKSRSEFVDGLKSISGFFSQNNELKNLNEIKK